MLWMRQAFPTSYKKARIGIIYPEASYLCRKEGQYVLGVFIFQWTGNPVGRAGYTTSLWFKGDPKDGQDVWTGYERIPEGNG